LNSLILILIFSLLLTSCGGDTDSTATDPALDEPVFIPMVSYDINSSGLSGVWESGCVLFGDLDEFKAAKLIYVISRNNKTIKNIISYYKRPECQGENTTLTFVMSCENRGTKIVGSGLIVEKNHCTKDRFWRESKKEGLVKLDKKIDFKIILYQSGANILYSNTNIDSSKYPNNIEWGLPYTRRILPIGMDIGIL